MPKVHYSSLAAQDLFENAEYIARDKPVAAYQWVEKIEQTCELLANNPDVGRERTARSLGRCRSFATGNYVIFFRGISDGIEIVRIIRGERDVERF